MTTIISLGIVEFPLDVRNNTIEIDSCRNRSHLFAQDVPSIESIDTNEKFGSVFQIDFQTNLFIRFVGCWVGRSKSNFDAFGEFFLSFGR